MEIITLPDHTPGSITVLDKTIERWRAWEEDIFPGRNMIGCCRMGRVETMVLEHLKSLRYIKNGLRFFNVVSGLLNDKFAYAMLKI